MSTLEQEIVERFDQLDEPARQRILRLLNERSAKFDWEALFAKADALYEAARAERGEPPPVDVVGILREIRNGEDE